MRTVKIGMALTGVIFGTMLAIVGLFLIAILTIIIWV
jgi:hypothetical protein